MKYEKYKHNKNLGGLISDVLSVFFTTSFIPLLIDILDPFYFLKLYKIYILKKEGSPTITQDDANLLLIYKISNKNNFSI